MCVCVCVVYVYMCMCVCVHICVHLHMYIYTYFMCTYIYVLNIPIFCTIWLKKCDFLTESSCSLLEHAAVLLWFMVLPVCPQGFFCLLVHCMNPVSAPVARRSCWLINGFLLSLRSCRCSPYGSWFFLFLHKVPSVSWFTILIRHSCWFF